MRVHIIFHVMQDWIFRSIAANLYLIRVIVDDHYYLYSHRHKLTNLYIQLK